MCKFCDDRPEKVCCECGNRVCCEVRVECVSCGAWMCPTCVVLLNRVKCGDCTILKQLERDVEVMYGR